MFGRIGTEATAVVKSSNLALSCSGGCVQGRQTRSWYFRNKGYSEYSYMGRRAGGQADQLDWRLVGASLKLRQVLAKIGRGHPEVSLPCSAVPLDTATAEACGWHASGARLWRRE